MRRIVKSKWLFAVRSTTSESRGLIFLVKGVVDPKYHNRIVTSPSDADSFNVCIRNGPRYYFVDRKDGAARDLTDLTDAMNQRILNDDSYLNCFVKIWWAEGHGIYMEECVDELTDDGSSPASRLVANRFSRDYEKLILDYDPTLPVSKVPQDIKMKLNKWRKDHYEGSSWQMMDDFNAEMDAETNPPPLNIRLADVPEPKTIPFQDEKDRAAYIEYYKFAYLEAANTKGVVGISCCLGETPNRNAKIDGHYAGVSDANAAKIEAAKRAFERKRQKSRKSP